MYDPPAYVWALTIAGPTATAAATCIALYNGAERAGLGRKRAALLTATAAVLLGGWHTATAVIAGNGWYDRRPSQVPWLPIAAAGSLGMLLVATRIPVVARALTAPGVASRRPGHLRRHNARRCGATPGIPRPVNVPDSIPDALWLTLTGAF